MQPEINIEVVLLSDQHIQAKKRQELESLQEAKSVHVSQWG